MIGFGLGKPRSGRAAPREARPSPATDGRGVMREWPPESELTAPERFLLRRADEWIARPLREHLLTVALYSTSTSGTLLFGPSERR